MNNSKFVIESVPLTLEETRDNKPYLRERESKIVRIITALQGVQSSKEWSSLKTELFDSLANNLEQKLKSEARKENPDTNKLNRFAGELKWAEQYSDLFKLEKEFRAELLQVKSLLYGKTEKTG